MALGNGNIPLMNNNMPVQQGPITRGMLAANQRGSVRNKQDQAAGVFRNKKVGKNDIPKAG